MEESNADKAIKALTAALAPKARVKRDGKVSTVEAKELVPGDIIIVMFGNIVPADIKLLGKENDSTETPMQVLPLLFLFSRSTQVFAQHHAAAKQSLMVTSCVRLETLSPRGSRRKVSEVDASVPFLTKPGFVVCRSTRLR